MSNTNIPQQSQQNNIVSAGGGTKHRVKRNRRRTVKAAATYGAAYRKYNRMYGGATEDPAPPPAAAAAPVEENKPGMWERIKNFVTPGKKDDAEENKAQEQPEEPGLFAKANAKVQETVKETVATAENVASTAENALQTTKDRVTKAADAVKQTASAVGNTLETSGALVKNQIGSAIETIDAADKDAAKTENDQEEEGNEAVIKEEKPVAPDAPESNGETGMTDDKRRIKELEERIRKMTSGTIAKAIEAAEQATGSVEDALKALQLAFIASKTVIAAGKAALVANSGNDEEAVLSQGADAELEPAPVVADNETGAEQASEASEAAAIPENGENTDNNNNNNNNNEESDAESSVTSDDKSDKSDSSSENGDAEAEVQEAEESSSSTPSRSPTTPAVPEAEAEAAAAAASDNIPPEKVDDGAAAEGGIEAPKQTDASKATDALNKIEGGKKHRHKTKNAVSVTNNRTRRH